LQIVQKEITATASAIAVITKKHSNEQPKIFNITAENILNAHTFQHKRDLLVNNGYCVYASKENGETNWYFD